ncbi:MAG: hypothetical protein DRO05_00475 [Thermoproteota archaeon]|nr:MAG: hypothetical protein DRO05_00475 [Candidatus Korarchaeota archaeon]
MSSKLKKRREILLRILDLCEKAVKEEMDPFQVDVVQLFGKLRELLPELETDEELYLDLEAVLGLTSVILKQDEWIRYRSSLMFLDPLLVLLKIEKLEDKDLADVLRRSWRPIVEARGISPLFLERALEYWRSLPALDERKIELGAEEEQTGSLTMSDLESLGFASEEEFLSFLRSEEERLRREADKRGGEVPYWEFIGAETFEETIRRAYLVSFLCSYGRATIRKDPISGEMWLIPLEKPMENKVSLAIPIDEEMWRKRNVGGRTEG